MGLGLAFAALAVFLSRILAESADATEMCLPDQVFGMTTDALFMYMAAQQIQASW